MMFFTEWMFDKYGMDDGDILDDLVFEHCDPTQYQEFDDHRLLFDVVTSHVAPAIHPDLAGRIVFTETTHNPLRIDDRSWWEDVWLDAPEFVEVSDDVIVEMLRGRVASTA